MAAASTLARARQALDGGRRARIVGRATLMAARADDAQQLRFAVEDALNTADFGDAGRLVLVRRLRLCNLPPRASPALVARALETAWRALALRAVPAAHASAPQADAVFFASPFDARLAWLARVAEGGAPGAWFWATALPELTAAGTAPPAAAIAAVIDALLQQHGGPAVAAALRHWPEAAAVALVRAMPATTRRQLLPALTASLPDSPRLSPAPAGTRAPTAGVASHWQAAVAQRLATLTPLDEATATLLAAWWLAPLLGRLPTLHEVRATVGLAIRSGGSTLRPPAGGSGASPEAPPVAARTTLPSAQASTGACRLTGHDVAAASPRAGDVAPRTPSPTWSMESGLAPQPRPAAPRGPARKATEPGWPWLADAAFTRCGGLMLVLNVLAALRIPRWLEGLPAGERHGFVIALLRGCLVCAEVAQDDPQRAWLDAEAEADVAERHPGLRLWTLRLRRTLRRHARMDLAELVRRRAWVSATPTHIDVIYALDQVDLRLRRLGLDADPGWVPWLGRIVSFHFIDAHLLPTEDGHG